MAKKVVVLHHEDNDGNCAGWIVKHYYSLIEHNVDATLFPVQYSRPVPLEALQMLDKETILYIVDFSYDVATLLKLQAMVSEIHVFDHHATAEAALKDLPFAIFSKERAGAGMTWDILFTQNNHPLLDQLRDVPRFVELVDDYDLWAFKNPDTKAFNAHSGLFDTRKPEFWDQFLFNDVLLDQFIQKGHTKLYFEDIEIDQIAKSSKIKYGNYTDVNKSYKIAIYQTTHNLSKLGNELLKQNPDVDFTMCWFIVPNESKIVFSLRTANDRALDVGKDICLPLGGGGHKNAAGFTMPISAGLTFLDTLYA